MKYLDSWNLNQYFEGKLCRVSTYCASAHGDQLIASLLICLESSYCTSAHGNQLIASLLICLESTYCTSAYGDQLIASLLIRLNYATVLVLQLTATMDDSIIAHKTEVFIVIKLTATSWWPPSTCDGGGHVSHPRGPRMHQHCLHQELQRIPAHGGICLGRGYCQQVTLFEHLNYDANSYRV